MKKKIRNFNDFLGSESDYSGEEEEDEDDLEEEDDSGSFRFDSIQ